MALPLLIQHRSPRTRQIQPQVLPITHFPTKHQVQTLHQESLPLCLPLGLQARTLHRKPLPLVLPIQPCLQRVQVLGEYLLVQRLALPQSLFLLVSQVLLIQPRFMLSHQKPFPALVLYRFPVKLQVLHQ